MLRFKFSFLLAMASLLVSAFVAWADPEQYDLPGEAVWPEGIAYQASTGDFFVGSTAGGNIYRGNVRVPEVTVFSPGGTDGRTDVRGMKVDGQGRLFVAGGTLSQTFVYNLANRQLLAKFSTGVAPSFVNDVTIAPNGDAYFTDSQSAYIYKIPTNLSTMEKWDVSASVPYTAGFNFNGIVATADGKYVIAVQSNRGKLWRVDTATKQAIEVNLNGADVTAGDGLLLNGQILNLMRNAAGQLLTLRFSTDFASVTPVDTTTNPKFSFPTTFARAGGRLLVVNSQLNKRTANQAPALPFQILNIADPATPLLPKSGADHAGAAMWGLALFGVGALGVSWWLRQRKAV